MFADGGFFTPDRKARFVEVSTAMAGQTAPGFPMTLNTGRVRDHWHTMTRTGKSQRLSQHCAEPYVEINPHDAKRHHIGDAELVRVSTGLGAILVRALVTPRQQPGSIFVPMHWNDQFASRARVDVLAAAVTDPISGQPATKNIPARVEPFRAAMYGFAVLRRKPVAIAAEYWAIAKCTGGWRVEMAFAANSDDWAGYVTALVGGNNELVAYHDAQTGRHRYACYDGDRLAGAVFLAPEPVAVSRDWAIAQLGAPNLARRQRTSVVAGRPGKGGIDRGATVCACFSVGANEIAAAVGARLRDSVGHRRSAARRHQLRLLPLRNSQHHRRATRDCGPSAAAYARRVGLRDHHARIPALAERADGNRPHRQRIASRDGGKPSLAAASARQWKRRRRTSLASRSTRHRQPRRRRPRRPGAAHPQGAESTARGRCHPV